MMKNLAGKPVFYLPGFIHDSRFSDKLQNPSADYAKNDDNVLPTVCDVYVLWIYYMRVKLSYFHMKHDFLIRKSNKKKRKHFNWSFVERAGKIGGNLSM